MRQPLAGVAALVLVALVAVGCTGEATTPTDATTSEPSVALELDALPSDVAADAPVERVVGHGTVTIDGTALDVTGDCDVSRDFGLLPVADPADPDVDIVLAVDNVDDATGTFTGPHAVAITLVDVGGTGRVLRGRGDANGPGQWSGDVLRLELRDRPGSAAAGTATLYLEAEQADVGGAVREVVIDVGCRVNGPT